MHEMALFKAFEIYGSQQALADNLGVTQQGANHWLNRAKKIPFKQALKLHYYTGGLIDITELTSEEPEWVSLWKHGLFLRGVPLFLMPTADIIKGNKKCPIYKDTLDICAHLKNPIDFYRPILIDQNNHLITCECRLRAHVERGDRKARVYRLDINTLLNNPNTESLVQNFPMSERVDIGLWVEKMQSGRRGERTDLELVENFPQVPSGNKTRQIAAHIAGFGNDRTYRQAKEVMRYGTRELIDATDNGLLKIYRAFQIARLAPENQLSLIKTISEKSKNLRKL